MFGLEKKRWIRQLAGLGKDSYIYNPYVISNPEKIMIGNNVKILDHARLSVCDSDSNEVTVQIDDGCYIAYNFSILAKDKIHIEENVLIASNVMVASHNHGMDPESGEYYMHQPLTGGEVVIGEGTWIGEKACILPGVTIGKKCVIGAGGVVTKSVPDYCIAGGNPARILKKYNFELHTWQRVQQCSMPGKTERHQ